MKVLYIIGGSGKQYGSEIIAMSILQHLYLDKGVEYTVITAKDGCINKLCRKLGIENYILDIRFYVFYEGKHSFLNKGKRIVRLAQAEYAAANALKKLEKMVQLESYDLIHTNLSRDLLGGIIKEKYHIPHIWHLQELFEGHYRLKMLKKDQVVWMNNRADAYIAISNKVATDWINHGLDREKVTVILNGIDLSDIKERNWKSKNEVIKIVMVGEICEAKGQIYCLEAINKILKNRAMKANLIVDFYGEGKKEYVDFLKSKVAEYQLQNVIALKGHCENVRTLLYGYDIAVNCSRGEGFGLVTVEAMASGLCVLAANTGANTEIISHNVNGIIFEYEDAVEELYRIFCEIIKSDDIVKKIGMIAQKEAREKYNLNNMCNQVFQLYRKVIREYV